MKKLNILKQFLFNEYIIKLNSSLKIAKKYNCSDTTIRNYLKKYNIKIRKSTTLQLGKSASNYKDGRSLKDYFCIDCGNKISIASGIYGQRRCGSCAKKYDYIINPKKSKGKNNGMYGKKFSKEMKKKFREKSKNNWKNIEFREKTIKATLKAIKIKPNKPEKFLNKLLQKILPNEYKYNKSFVIAGLVPDFVNKRRKKIIELYGCYWHKCPKCKFGKGRKVDKTRAGIYDLFANYKTLIIWEHELKNMNRLKEKVKDFHYDKK